MSQFFQIAVQIEGIHAILEAENEGGTDGMTDPMIAYCGVDCAPCPDYAGGKCPGCRATEWGDDPCLPVRCCREKGIALCGECERFPCRNMADFYGESEGHKAAYLRMCIVREKR